jgi:stage II sporulation protein AA (anti-sigma F factor antagonist)
VPSEPLQISLLGDDGGVLRVRLANHLTQEDVQGDQDPLVALIGEAGFARKVLMDLGRVTYIDSSGISWLLICHKRFVQSGGKLVLHSVPPLVDQVLQLLRLPLILQMATDEKAARTLAVGGKA